jgi:hypothetical protein
MRVAITNAIVLPLLAGLFGLICRFGSQLSTKPELRRQTGAVAPAGRARRAFRFSIGPR